VVKVNNETIGLGTDGLYHYNKANKAGSYTITAFVPENSEYYNGFNSTSFNVVKHTTSIEISPVVDAKVDKPATIIVNTNSTGKMTIKVNDVVVENNTGYIPSSAGNYTITVSVEENDEYSAASASSTFTVTRNDALININVTTPVYAGENVTVTLSDVPSDATGPVIVTINNNSYVIDNINETQSINIPINTAGDYNITVNYLGDNKYDPVSSDTTVFSVSKVPGNMSNVNVTVGGASVGKDISVNVDLPGDATGNLTVSIDGKNITTVPAKGGSNIISVPSTGLSEGEHNVTVIYSGDDKYAGVNSSSVVSVVPGLVETDHAAGKAKLVLDFYDGTYYVVRAYGDDGLPVGAKEVIGFHVNGRDYNGITDKNGYAKLRINLNPGTYTITAQYHTYKVSQKIQVKQTLKLVKKTVSVKKGKKLVLKAKLAWTLKSNKGKSLKGKKIVFKFKGKKYTAKTNSKGVAKVTIKTKVTKKLKAGKKYSFSATYITNTVKGKVKVKK
jgi:hypothetical protein